ncbi:hypothetical protein GGS26DRAFT_603952 [Hypomontagnella submonticulosa]|nr:hypothetical protein GGS26DRAFT_603952 [Hypomontagnella submonticulosa]
MCRSCAVITQATFSCGHQAFYYYDKARFCLFFPHRHTDFHMASIAYSNKIYQEACLECVLKDEANQKGLHGKQRHEYIRGHFAKSQDKASRDLAKQHIDRADASQRVALSADQVAELNAKAQSQVRYYLQRGLGKSSKVNLFKTVLQVPPAIDKKALVRAFGTYCVWDTKKEAGVWRGLPSEERTVLLNIARRGAMIRALEEGFKAENPVEVKPKEEEKEQAEQAEKAEEVKTEDTKKEEPKTEKPAEVKTAEAKKTATKKTGAKKTGAKKTGKK